MDVRLTEMVCGHCGVVFAIPDFMYREVRETKQTWYCPNGHPRAYVESTAERLQKSLDAAHERAAVNFKRALDAESALARCEKKVKPKKVCKARK